MKLENYLKKHFLILRDGKSNKKDDYINKGRYVMAYILNEVTIRTDNSEKGIQAINELWQDISIGKIPILFDSEHEFQTGISPISKYSNYEGDESGKYNLTVMAVKAEFFKLIEDKINNRKYVRYEEKDENGDISVCAQKAWERVWNDQKSGSIDRSFTEDFESTVPKEYTKDGAAHCYLYIAVK